MLFANHQNKTCTAISANRVSYMGSQWYAISNNLIKGQKYTVIGMNGIRLIVMDDDTSSTLLEREQNGNS